MTGSRIEDFQHGRVPRRVRERQLVELAEELFAERGYQGASMEELARRAGVTKPIVYELFGNKDGLFRACLQRSADQLAELVAATRYGPSRSPRRGCAPEGSPSCASPPTTGWPGS